MYSVQSILFISLCFFVAAFAGTSKKNTPSEVVIHATNLTSVPSVLYLVDAVECLKEAYTIYDNDTERVKVYAELFEAKHNETQWSVVAGYTAIYINAQWYVETSVTGGKQQYSKKDKNEDKTDTFYLIFSKS